MKPSKKAFFYVIAAMIPLGFFVLLELGLRAVGYGETTPLFVENPANKKYQLPRPDVMARYFKDSAQRPTVTLEANFLLKQKPQNGLRIFVQGGSTAAGFPYGMGASIAGTLDHRIKQSLPGKYVEVVNTALSAVNSYTLLDFTDEIIAQSPDAVLIYAGHNEYLGILGIGSSFQTAGSEQMTLMYLALKDYRIFQLLQNIFGIFAPDAPQSDTQARTFMAKAAAQRSIVYDSELFHRGLQQFKRNMSRLLDKYADAGIPVFLSTIASNQSDQPPFVSEPISQQQAQYIESSQQAIANGKLAEIEKYSQWINLSSNAELHFQFARLLSNAGLYTLAKQHFGMAVDYDQLRFRAPHQINDIIRELSLRDGVFLVDAHAALEARSPNQIVGQSLMLEHLHPNLQGYFVISEAFYQTLSESKLFGTWKHIPIASAWSERLILPAEEYFGFATVQKLTSDYPFTQSPQPLKLPAPADWQQQLGLDLFEQRIDWLTMMQTSLQHYRQQGDQRMAFKTLQILADAMPHNGLYNIQIAEIMQAKGRYNLAAYYFTRAKNAGAVTTDLDRQISAMWEKAEQRMK